MKQTAVEWLVKTLTINGFIAPSLIKEEIEQAKEMEKQEIVDAHNNAKNILPPNENGEQYYNETFKK